MRLLKNRPANSRLAKLLASAASGCLVAAALAIGLLRGATADETAPADASAPVAETARVEPKKPASPNDPSPAEPDARLFGRPRFDPSLIRMGSHGGFLIRLAAILRHPALEVYAQDLNEKLSQALCELLVMPPGTLAAGDIDWIAGDSFVLTKPAKPDGKSTLMMGARSVVIGMNRAADWQELVLKNAAGSAFKTYEGKSYVQLPVWPLMGPAAPCLRFPNETTIVAFLAGPDVAEGEAKQLKRFFDDTPGNYPWANAWAAADGGLITMVFDNRKVGWHDLREENKEWPEGVWPLAEKTVYFALGLDWNNQGDRAGVQVHSSCSDAGTAEEVRQSTLAALGFWIEQIKTDNDVSPEIRQSLQQFVADAKVELSNPDSPDPSVHTTGGFDLSAPELIDSIPFTEPVQARGKQ